MRTLRVVVVGALLAGGLAVLAPGANAQEPAVPEICQSLATLNSKVEGFGIGFIAGKSDIGAPASTGGPYPSTSPPPSLGDLSNSFLQAAETAPEDLKPAMNTIATVIADAVASGNTSAALTKNAASLIFAGLTLRNYFDTNCKQAGSSVSTPPPAAFGFAHKACSLISAYDDDLDRAFEKARQERKKVVAFPQKASLADAKRWSVNAARASTDLTSALLSKLRALGSPNAKEERAAYTALVADVSKLRDTYARALRGARKLSTTSKETAQRQYNRLLTTENGVPQFLPYYARVMGHSVTLAEANPPSTVSWGTHPNLPPSTVPYGEGRLTADQACKDVVSKEAS